MERMSRGETAALVALLDLIGYRKAAHMQWVLNEWVEAQREEARHHLPWSDQEHRQVVQAFQRGELIPDIAERHRRSPLAIEARLVKEGLVEDRFADKKKVVRRRRRK